MSLRAVLTSFGILNNSADLRREGERDFRQGDSAGGDESGSMGGGKSDHLHKVDDGGPGIGGGIGGGGDASGTEGQSVPKVDKGKRRAGDCGDGGDDSSEDKPLSDKEYLDWIKLRDRFMASSVGNTPTAGNPANPYVAPGSYTPVRGVGDEKGEPVPEMDKGTGRASGCDSNGSGVSGSDKGDSDGGGGSRGPGGKPLSDKESIEWIQMRDRLISGPVGNTPAAGDPRKPHVPPSSHAPISGAGDGNSKLYKMEDHPLAGSVGNTPASGYPTNTHIAPGSHTPVSGTGDRKESDGSDGDGSGGGFWGSHWGSRERNIFSDEDYSGFLKMEDRPIADSVGNTPAGDYPVNTNLAPSSHTFVSGAGDGKEEPVSKVDLRGSGGIGSGSGGGSGGGIGRGSGGGSGGGGSDGHGKALAQKPDTSMIKCDSRIPAGPLSVEEYSTWIKKRDQIIASSVSSPLSGSDPAHAHVPSCPHARGSGAGDGEGKPISKVAKSKSKASGSGTGGSSGVSGGDGRSGSGAGDGEGKPISKVGKGKASGSGTGGSGVSGGGSGSGRGGKSGSGGRTASGAIQLNRLRRRLRGSSSDDSAAGTDSAPGLSASSPANNPQQGRRLKLLTYLYGHKWVLAVTGFAGTLVGCGFHLPDLPMESVSNAYRPVANKFFHFSYLWGGSMLISYLARFVFRRARARLHRVRRLPARDLEAGELPAM